MGRCLVLLALLLPLLAAPPAGAAERRCGWIHNPTPANWWLVDRDGRWDIAFQGERRPPGMDEIPDLTANEWERTNGWYGYGCGCMTVETDPAARRIRRIMAVQQLPLARCRADRALPRMD
jgi:hypothetical protein